MNEVAQAFAQWPAWAGSVPGWVMAIGFLGILWKGLPSVLDAWSNSVAKEREHREREIKRLEDQITASDERHAECMDGQRKLREEIDRLQGIISGMVIQMRQMQLAAIDGGPIAPATIPTEFAAMLAALEKRDQPKRGKK